MGHRQYTLRPRQNGRHFPDDIFKWIFLNENVWILIKISLKFIPKGPINNIPALVQTMAWRRSGDKPLSQPMMVNLPTHICVTQPQWVNLKMDMDGAFHPSGHYWYYYLGILFLGYPYGLIAHKKHWCTDDCLTLWAKNTAYISLSLQNAHNNCFEHFGETEQCYIMGWAKVSACMRQCLFNTLYAEWFLLLFWRDLSICMHFASVLAYGCCWNSIKKTHPVNVSWSCHCHQE